MPGDDGLVLVQQAVSCVWVRKQGGYMRAARRLGGIDVVSDGRKRDVERGIRSGDGLVAEQGRLRGVWGRRHG